LIRKLDRTRFAPELCCLKEEGPLGEVLAEEIPVFSNQIHGKYDLLIYRRLARLLDQRRIDAVVTVGAGDKMFWGRLAARRARVPVVLSALHSTGWPDGIGRLNRMLTPITDGFIGVADEHGRHLVENEGFPAEKVFVIPNGVDTERFRAGRDVSELRRQLKIPADARVAGIVAALRPEKNHELLLQAAAAVRKQLDPAHYLIIGDGPRRAALEQQTGELGLTDRVHFLGTRSDIPELLSLLDVFVLTSHMEANPVSILEAMSTGKPVIAPRVGSIPESVTDGETGYLFDPGDLETLTKKLAECLGDGARSTEMGTVGRQVVAAQWSLDRMVRGYEDLIETLYDRRCAISRGGPGPCYASDSTSSSLISAAESN
jgi:glycosyltransferase involved in cell wall biosynthesis